MLRSWRITALLMVIVTSLTGIYFLVRPARPLEAIDKRNTTELSPQIDRTLTKPPSTESMPQSEKPPEEQKKNKPSAETEARPEVKKETKPPTKTYYVSPEGSDSAGGLRENEPLLTIQEGLRRAEPGEMIKLSDGVFRENIRTVRDGLSDRPITISGSPASTLKAKTPQSRLVEINHSFIELIGFTIDGQIENNRAENPEDFADKLIYVIGNRAKTPTKGVRIIRMRLTNAGGECLRLRYLIEDSEVADSQITRCGLYDYKFKEGGKNGEGVYLGTAPEQLSDGKAPSKDHDTSRRNRIHRNIFDTQGNECVDIKEYAEQNRVEFNSCTGQKDKESGGIDVRGNNNIVANNTIFDVLGAGIRLGGDQPTDGINNQVISNTIRGSYRSAVKITRSPQAPICANLLSGSGPAVDLATKAIKTLDPTAPCP